MSFDFYAELAAQAQCPETADLPGGLASGFVDGCMAWSTRGSDAKNEARNCYMERAQEGELSLPNELAPFLDPTPCVVQPGWLAIEVTFTLQTPWYSKDDRPFHVIDNPVRKDRVFGLPYMPAASWKGLLRWACRMQAGLREHFESGKQFKDWSDPDWILHLFGNEKGEENDFHRGALVFYPTWFNRIGFEVINPHSRVRRAGTQPILYEVVPPGTTGKLHLLYGPWPGMNPSAKPPDFLPHLLEAIEHLLTRYGISAKRTSGWGTAEISKWRAWKKDESVAEASSREGLVEHVKSWLESEART
jgi:CRISPR-associated protein Cmr2